MADTYYTATKYRISFCNPTSWDYIAGPVLLQNQNDLVADFDIDEFNPLYLYSNCYRYTITGSAVYDPAKIYAVPEGASGDWYPADEYGGFGTDAWSTEDRNSHDTKTYGDGLCDCESATAFKWSATTCSDCTFDAGYPTAWNGVANDPGPYKSSNHPLPGLNEDDLTLDGTSIPKTVYVGCIAYTIELCETAGSPCAGLQEAHLGPFDSDQINYQWTIDDNLEVKGFDADDCCEKHLECVGEILDGVCTEGYGTGVDTCVEEGIDCEPPTPAPVEPEIGGDPHVRTFFNKKYDM